MKISMFSFLPTDFKAMQTFLEAKLEEGLRLKWVKWGIAGFEELDENTDYFIYAVDPYVNQNAISFGKMPRVRQNMYMENKWVFIGKTGGTHIYYSTSEEGEYIPVDDDAKQKVGKSCMTRNGAVVAAVLLLAYYLSQSKAFMYNMLLSSTMQGIAVLGAFLALASVFAIFANASALASYGGDGYEAAKKRGLILPIRRFGLLAILLIFFIIALSKKPEAIPFAVIPLVIISIAGIIIVLMAKKSPVNLQKRITPVVIIAGALMTFAIVYSVSGMNTNTSRSAAQRNQDALAKSDSVPVLHYEQFFDGECNSTCKENNTVIGENYLFQEFNDEADKIVFSNYTKLNYKFAVNKIFNYLYDQASSDYGGSFELIDEKENVSIYKISGHNSYLIRDDKEMIVLLLNIIGEADEEKAEKIILSMI